MLSVKVLFLFITKKQKKKQTSKPDSEKKISIYAVPATLTRFHGKKILPNLCNLFIQGKIITQKLFKKTTAKFPEFFIGNLSTQVPLR